MRNPWKNKHGEWSIFRIIFTIATIVILVLSFIAGIRTVPSGTVGVTLSWGSITGVTGEGLHWVPWFFGQDIALVNTEILAFESGAQSTGSIDLQEATTNVTVNYRVDPDFATDVYRNFKNQFEGRMIKGQVEDALKATTARFTSTQLLHERPTVRKMFFDLLTERLAPYHIVVLEVAITDFQFSEEFKAQLEATATSTAQIEEERANLEIKTLQEQQRIIEALATYNVTITNEQAAAEAAKIKADMDAYCQIVTANATAEAIRMVTEQLTLNPEYLEYLAILRWNGVLPLYWASDAPIPFLPIAP